MKGQESFHSRFAGHCRGCGKRYARGENVWSPKPQGSFHTQSAGLFHIRCQPAVTVRQMTPQDLIDLDQSRARKAMGAVE